ncbi:nuclear transport factor 2 family protein [bacterium]
MKKRLVIVMVILSTLFLAVLTVASDDGEAVKTVIKKSYFNGAFNELDTESMRKGFHADFAIFSAKGNEISRYPIDTWIEGIEKRKQDPNFDKSKSKMDCKIVSLDVTGGSASVKVEISKDGQMVYTDYLSLLKFKDGWKIVAKVYHSHPHK